MDDKTWLFLFLLGIALLIWRWFARRAEGSDQASPKHDPSTGPRSAREPLNIPKQRPPHRGRKVWKPLTPEELARRKQQEEEDRRDRQVAQRQAAEEKRLKEEQERKDSLDRVEKANAEEVERRRRQEARKMMDTTVGRDYQHYIGQPIPAQIRRSMEAFRAGEFVGADRSPLAYVGYHVGKTNGLPVRDREQRLLACFRIDIPKDLIADYRDWAGPASRQRLGKMRGHLKMLAAMRRDRPGFEVAVAEWERDAEWLQTEVGTLAETFDRHGVTW